METGRALFIEWLKEIGATQITDLGDDETISFEHNGKKIRFMEFGSTIELLELG